MLHRTGGVRCQSTNINEFQTRKLGTKASVHSVYVNPRGKLKTEVLHPARTFERTRFHNVTAPKTPRVDVPQSVGPKRETMSKPIARRGDQQTLGYVRVATSICEWVDFQVYSAELSSALPQITDHTLIRKIRVRRGVNAAPAKWQEDFYQRRGQVHVRECSNSAFCLRSCTASPISEKPVIMRR